MQENDDSAIRRDPRTLRPRQIEVAAVAAEFLREDVAESVRPGKRICTALDEIAPGDDNGGGMTESPCSELFVQDAFARRDDSGEGQTSACWRGRRRL